MPNFICVSKHTLGVCGHTLWNEFCDREKYTVCEQLGEYWYTKVWFALRGRRTESQRQVEPFLHCARADIHVYFLSPNVLVVSRWSSVCQNWLNLGTFAMITVLKVGVKTSCKFYLLKRNRAGVFICVSMHSSVPPTYYLYICIHEYHESIKIQNVKVVFLC